MNKKLVATRIYAVCVLILGIFELNHERHTYLKYVKFKFDKIEQIAFYLMLATNACVILYFNYFPSLDGPAHLYNSQLINSLLFEDSEFLKEFFVFNKEFIPNWTSHFVLSSLSTFLSPLISEKILLLVYVIGLPMAFRKLIHTLNEGNVSMSSIIFPFVFSFPLLLGFYNFCLALVVMLVVLRFWLQTDWKNYMIRDILLLSLLLLLLYFSHLFVLTITLLIIGVQILSSSVIAFSPLNNIKASITYALKKAGIVLLSSIIPLILSVNFFLSRTYDNIKIYKENSELLTELIDIRSVIMFNQGSEIPYTRILVILYLVLIINVIVNYIRSKKRNKNDSIKDSERNSIQKNGAFHVYWLIASIIILTLYFVLPEATAISGYISIRLSLIFFILLSIWVSIQVLQRWMKYVVLSSILICHFGLIGYYFHLLESKNSIALSCVEMSDHIENETVIFSIHNINCWECFHFSNFLGINKDVVILDNYECATDYFPLKWKGEMHNTFPLNGINDKLSFQNWINQNENNLQKIDYIFVIGKLKNEFDRGNNEIYDVVMENYSLIESDEHCELYKIL